MKLIPSVPEYQDDTAARALWARFDGSLRNRDGLAYYKHPVISSSTNTAPDLTMLAKDVQPIVVKIFDRPIEELSDIGEDVWEVGGVDQESPLLDLEDYLVGLKARFDKQRPLRGKFDPVGVLAFPRINRQQFLHAFPDAPIDVDGNESQVRLLFRDDNLDRNVFNEIDLSIDDWRLAQSVFQGVHPLNKAKSAVILDRTKMGNAIKALNHQIALLDDEQNQVATQLAPGPQRIRGLAGTGKTVILAMKAANIHLHYPEAKILFTFNTQSLYQQIERLISQFYRVNGDISPNWDLLHVRHGWGSSRRPGVYSDTCRRSGIAPLSFTEARRRSFNDPFGAACRELGTQSILEEYDFVLMDEAQDFPADFFKILGKITKEPKRIYFAYDEMQSLTNIEIPNPKELFGNRDDGSPIVDLDGDPYAGDIDRDFVLHKSYRCPRDVLLTAHGVGLGIHSPNGCVQMLSTRESWEAVGYSVEVGDFTAGAPMRLSRSSENSPNKIAQLYDGNESPVTLERFESIEDELSAVARRIKGEIVDQLVRPEDIVVICLDNRQAKKYFQKLQRSLYELDVESTIPGLIDESWEFTQEGSVTLSTIYRAKGNEAAVIHLIGFEALYGYTEEVENRNRAFTSISRAKGWIRIYGSGPFMRLAEGELNRIIADLPTLQFDFPDMAIVERKLDSVESTRRRKTVGRVKKGVTEILEADEAALMDLDPVQIRLLSERLKRIADER